MSTKVEETIEVNAPLRAVYNQWTQFEQFPMFMEGVKQVEQITDQTLKWVAEIAGVQRQWLAAILEQIPDQKVAWAATEGATNAGAVYFSPLAAGKTFVRLVLEYEPEGFVEKAGDWLKIVQAQAKADLERFKTFIEGRGLETGGWRGAVNAGAAVGTPGVEAAASSRGDSGKVDDTGAGSATPASGTNTGTDTGTDTTTGGSSVPTVT